MTDKQINIAIAKEFGIEEELFGPSWYQRYTKMPDYCNDLNAMHEAEKVLTDSRHRVQYAKELAWIWTGQSDRAIPDWWFIHDATARQRAEAFLRTIGKWEEVQP